MERDITQVIDKMLNIVPTAEDELRVGLTSIKSDACYCPPEHMSREWRRGAELLFKHLGAPPLDGWREEIRRIWMGET